MKINGLSGPRWKKRGGYENFKDIVFYYEDEAARFDIGDGFYTGSGVRGSDTINDYIESLIIDGFTPSDYSGSEEGPIVPIAVYFKGIADATMSKGGFEEQGSYEDEREILSVNISLISERDLHIDALVPDEFVYDFHMLYEDKIDEVELDFEPAYEDDMEERARAKSIREYDRDLI